MQEVDGEADVRPYCRGGRKGRFGGGRWRMGGWNWWGGVWESQFLRSVGRRLCKPGCLTARTARPRWGGHVGRKP
eukprot:351886-Chlamydomonas_euryale.AAC.5